MLAQHGCSFPIVAGWTERLHHMHIRGVLMNPWDSMIRMPGSLQRLTTTLASSCGGFPEPCPMFFGAESTHRRTWTMLLVRVGPQRPAYCSFSHVGSILSGPRRVAPHYQTQKSGRTSVLLPQRGFFRPRTEASSPGTEVRPVTVYGPRDRQPATAHVLQ